MSDMWEGAVQGAWLKHSSKRKPASARASTRGLVSRGEP